ncbi:endoribonuclease Dicer [Pseudohyphozyma bogoriensis]|nr:endoribonuclease Dicer [Pseudohyphozyma bogoriensis]
MGKSRKPTRHALPVASPYSIQTAPAQEKNLQVKPLTTPAGRTLPVKKAKKKAAPILPLDVPPVHKVGLGAIGPSSKPHPQPLFIDSPLGAISISGPPTATHVAARGAALQASIQAVLEARPAAVAEKEKEERDRRIAVEKDAAGKLRRELMTESEPQLDHPAFVHQPQVLIPVSDSDDDEDDGDEDDSEDDWDPLSILPKQQSASGTRLTPSRVVPPDELDDGPLIISRLPLPQFNAGDQLASNEIEDGEVVDPQHVAKEDMAMEMDLDGDEDDPSPFAMSPPQAVTKQLGMAGWASKRNVVGSGCGSMEVDAHSVPIPTFTLPQPTLPRPFATGYSSGAFKPTFGAPCTTVLTPAPPQPLVLDPPFPPHPPINPAQVALPPDEDQAELFDEAMDDEGLLVSASSKSPPSDADDEDEDADLIITSVPPTRSNVRTKILGKKKKRKMYTLKKKTAELFDYQIDSDAEEDDWDRPYTFSNVVKRKGRHAQSGRALDGALAEGDHVGLGGGEIPEVVPRLGYESEKAKVERLVPLGYQSALLKEAKEGNVITVMPTGSGKTLVAVLLIEWMHTEVEPARLAAGGKKKLQFFLVNSVPLVVQQANILALNSSLRVGKLFGALGINLSSKEEWEWNFQHYDCLVLTAQLLLDSLAHGFINMSEISLMVFDEAHHAKSNHPYAAILRDFYGRVPVDEPRPRILGLTASPLNSNEGLVEADKLQKLFDARLITAPAECLQELHDMVSAPTELVFKYHAPPQYPPTKLWRQIHKVVEFRDETFNSCASAAQALLMEHGPDASDLVWHLALERYQKSLETLDDPEASTIILDPIASPLAREEDFELVHPPRPVEEIVEEQMKPAEEEEPALQLPEWLRVIQAHKPQPKVDKLSPKLKVLLKCLAAFQETADSFCGIVFVNKRIDALIITQLLRQFTKSIPELSWLRVKCVTGHGATKSRSMGPRMQWTEQADVLLDFRQGECNLLVATSVVEEGLDVQPRNAVIRFDLYDTHIAMSQSRGRARRAGSHYILFVQEGNPSDARKIAKIREFDQKVGKLLAGVQEAYDADYGDDAEEQPTYLVEPSTNAVLTPHFAVSLLYRYCQALPASDAFNSNKPRFDFKEIYVEFEKRFICSVTFPPSSKVRNVISEPHDTPKAAKRHASFVACRLLHDYKALDEHFLPVRIFGAEDEPQDEEGRTIGSRKRQIGYERKLADEWSIKTPFGETSLLYPTVMRYRGRSDGKMELQGEIYSPFVLLSRNPLPKPPNLKLFIEGQPHEMVAVPFPAPLSVSPSQRTILQKYALRVFTTVLNKPFDVNGDEALWFIAPLAGSLAAGWTPDINSLDWEAMEYGADVLEEPLKMEDLPHLNDHVIVDLGKNQCRYFFKCVSPELHPMSTLPPGRQSDAGFTNVLDYYRSFNEPIFHKANINMQQPLLQVTRVKPNVLFEKHPADIVLSQLPRVVSYLTPTPRNDYTISSKQLLHLCDKHAISGSLLRSYLMLPSIMTQLDQLFLVRELNLNIFGGHLDPNLVRAALTTPSACLEDDYQRLELLGDAFLKYVSSVYCFVTLDKTAHEGDLHHTRLEFIKNSTLFKAGLELNIPAYLMSRPFTSRLYQPPNFRLLRGQAYETGFARGGITEGFALALQAAIALKVDLKGVSSWSDFAKLYGPIETRVIAERPIAIEEKLNRQFTHAHLLTEALTHPSTLNAAASFQRLEWLGDSLLDFLVVRYCWAKWGGTLPPGHLTELKGAMVSNETLAALAVELELDSYMAYDNPLLTTTIKAYRSRITKAKETEIREAEEEGRELRPFWLLLDAPKAVADLIESCFGAVFVDSGFDPAAPQATFDHLLVPFYEKWVSPTKLRIDAIRILLELAQANACEDVTHISSTVDGRVSENGEGKNRLTPNPKTAKRLVSALALQYLQQHGDFFSRMCDCETKRAIAKEEAEEELERRRNEGLESDESETEDESEEGGDGEIDLNDGMEC